MKFTYLNRPKFSYFDGEEGQEGGNTSDEGDDNTFTQDDVSKLVEVEKTKFQKERAKMAQQLEEIQKTATLNKEQKSELEQQVTALREASMSVEERAKAAIERKDKDFSDKLTTLEASRNKWEKKYTQTRIKNSILSAANGNELRPFHSDDIFNAIGPDTYLKERVDEIGKKTGEYDVKVKFTDVDENGKTQVLDIEPTQAISKMCKMPRWKHLFQSSKKSGTGGSASMQGKDVDLAKLAASDTKRFLELTKEDPSLLD